MKLYASIQSEHELLNYLGQDAWVKCKYKHSSYVYVRVLAKVAGFNSYYPRYIVCGLDRDDISHLITDSQDQAMARLTMYSAADIREFEVIHPLDVKPTSYFYTEYSPDVEQFDKFLGKDIWVLARRYGSYEFYVLPIARSGNQLICNFIQYGYIAGDYSMDLYDYKKLHNDIEINSGKSVSVDAWELISPLDVLTTEEVLDAIDFHNPTLAGNMLLEEEE